MKAIYARQSVDRPDSVSIESQIEFCQYETRGEPYALYVDRGYSGKNIDRPQLKEMIRSIELGEITQVIVYKLDRISRSILDFSNMMEKFQKYNVDFVSSTEKFDTSSPMGRAMLNICIVFAQLERETIQKRVQDAYLSRSKRGFYMGGRIPYGYELVATTINGIKTSKYKVLEEEAEHLKLIYELYSRPQTSLGDVVRFLNENNIKNNREKDWDRTRIGEIIKSPIYVKSDLAVFEFFKSEGAILCNDPSEFIGENGCYLFKGKGSQNKTVGLSEHNVVLAPHEGIIDSDIWLKVRRKSLSNRQVQKPLKAKNTWLAGKVKCGLCGYALTIKKSKTVAGRYFVCSKRIQSHSCEGAGTIYASDFEFLVFEQIKEKLSSFKTLSSKPEKKINPKVTEYNIRLKQLNSEIDTLIGKITSSTDVLMKYINNRVSELDEQKKELQNNIKLLSTPSSNIDADTISNYLNQWDELSFDDKRLVVDTVIEVIYVKRDFIQIKWRI